MKGKKIGVQILWEGPIELKVKLYNNQLYSGRSVHRVKQKYGRVENADVMTRHIHQKKVGADLLQRKIT